VLTLSESLDSQSEGEKSQEEDIEVLKAREDAAEALETPEEPFDLVALAVHGFVILPGFEAIALGWNHRNKAEIQRQLAGFVVFLGSVHDEVQRCWQRPDAAQQGARPSTVSEAWPGESEKVMAARAFAATI